MRRRGASDLSSEGSFDAFLGTVTKNGLGMLVLVAMASTFSSQLTLGQGKFKRSLGTPIVQLAPPGTKVVGFECLRGRAFPMEFETFAQADKDFFNASNQGANMDQLAAQYNAQQIAHPYWKLEFKGQGGHPEFPNEPTILLHPKPGPLGETLEEAQKPESVFRKRLQTLDKKNAVVHLRVWADSFKEFRELRDWLQREGYEVGWFPAERPICLLHPVRFPGGPGIKG
jgi:hypothetical protein